MSMKTGTIMARFDAKEIAKTAFDAARDHYVNSLGESIDRIRAAAKAMDDARSVYQAAHDSWIDSLR